MHRFSLCRTGSAHIRGLRDAHASCQKGIKGREDSHLLSRFLYCARRVRLSSGQCNRTGSSYPITTSALDIHREYYIRLGKSPGLPLRKSASRPTHLQDTYRLLPPRVPTSPTSIYFRSIPDKNIGYLYRSTGSRLPTS